MGADEQSEEMMTLLEQRQAMVTLLRLAIDEGAGYVDLET